MSSSDDSSFWSRTAKPSVASAVGLSLRDQVSLALAARWRWLEELRSRADLSIELFDTSLTLVLPPPPERAGAARGVIAEHPLIRRAVATTLKTLDARALTTETLRVTVRAVL